MTDTFKSSTYRIQINSDANGVYANTVVLNVAQGMGIEISIDSDGVIHLSPKAKLHCDTQSLSQNEAVAKQQDPSDITKSPRVLISYSQDSEQHSARVLALSNRLREDGVDCRIDQYEPDPPSGWPHWMNEQLEMSDVVLVLFTARYVEKTQTPKQSGVRFESTLILQDLYDAAMINEKFIPILFSSRDTEHISRWLKSYTHYVVGNDHGYDLLRRRLIGDPKVIMPPVGMPKKKGPV